MRRELVFTAHPGSASLARPVSLAAAGLRERSDLQEWIRAHPQILGPGVRIVTYEFDQWMSGAGPHGDRLDLLGLGEDGRLVLAELKRDGAPDTVEMQAIKYAAYASRFDLETLGACHGHYLRATLDPSITDDDALSQLEEHCGTLDPDVLATPRIVLVAGSFPESVTAAVVWLCEQTLDITLVQIAGYQCEQDLVITVSQLWPLPQVEDLTISPVAPTTRSGTRRRKRPASTAVTILADGGVIADGTELQIAPGGGRYAAAVTAWIGEQPERGRAVWRTGERVKALEWLVDGQRYSASGLAERIVREAAGASTALVGPEWWSLKDGTTLAELAGTAVGTRRDWAPLHALLKRLHPGEWTTYGELAEAIGSHPIAVGQHIAKCSDGCQHAWRVLGADGRPRPSFAWSDPSETRTCRDVLEEEGVSFAAAGNAEQANRVDLDDLRSRLNRVEARGE